MFDLQNPASDPDWPALSVALQGSGLLQMSAAMDFVAARCRGRLTYLATPYSREVTDHGRFSVHRSDLMGHAAADWQKRLALVGVSAVSPIVQAVAMLDAPGVVDLDPLDDQFWTAWCAPMLAAAAALIIPPIDGWQRSRGIWAEALSLLRWNRPVFVLAPDAPVTLVTLDRVSVSRARPALKKVA